MTPLTPRRQWVGARKFNDSTFVGGNGKTYTTDTLSRGTYYDLQPDFGDRGRLVFDVRAAAIPGAKLNLADCQVIGLLEPDQGCPTAKVSLGLR